MASICFRKVASPIKGLCFRKQKRTFILIHAKESRIISNPIAYLLENKLFKNASIYTLANIIKNAIPFILLPILTRYLSPADYGRVSTFQVILGVMVVFVGLNMNGAISVNFFRMKPEGFRVYIGNIFFILFFNAVIIFIIVQFFKSSLSHLIKFPEIWLSITVVAAFFQFITLIVLVIWQVEQRPLPYGFFLISQTIVNVVLSLLFVIYFDWRWEGRLLGILTAITIFSLVGLFIIRKRKYVTFSLNWIYIKDALTFSIPLIPHALGSLIIVGIDKIFINSMINVAATGIYTVGYQIGMIVGILATAFNQAWVPFLFEKLKSDRNTSKLRIVKFTYCYFIIIIFIALLLSLIAPYLLRIFIGKYFQQASQYVTWIALGQAFNGMYYMVVNYIFYVKKTYLLAWVTFFSAGINMLLNYYLITANGAIGAAQATTITFFICFVLVWGLSAYVYKMPWGLRKA